MVRVNEQGYLEKKVSYRGQGIHKNDLLGWRDWWLVKHVSDGRGCLRIYGEKSRMNITIPKKYIGKRIRLKVEVLE